MIFQRRLSSKGHWLLLIASYVLALAIGVGACLVYSNYYKDTGANIAVPSAPSVLHPHYVNWDENVRGITLSALQDFIVNDSTVNMMERQCVAARNHWKANTIRLQVLQDRLVGGTGQKWNRHYFYYVRKVVDYCSGIGLKVWINAQTEVSMGFAKNEPAPTHATLIFWQRMLNFWTNNPNIVFDLFNEPRDQTWEQWLNGGRLVGWIGKYVGEQQIVSFIRKEGASNTIAVEGINWASTLAGVPHLKGGNIIYTFHHPGSPHPDKDVIPGPRVWWDSFGYLAAEGYKVVDAEFANYIGNYYWNRDPGKTVSVYLDYLQAHHIGVMCWTLTAGSLNANGDFRTETGEPQGDGEIVAKFFQGQSHKERILVLAARRKAKG